MSTANFPMGPEFDKICLDTIQKYLNDTLYFKDLDSKFIWNNDHHARQLGAADASELVGKSDFDYFPKEFAQSARETEMMIIATGEPIINVVEELVLDDETTRYFMASKYPFYNANHEIIGTWGISKDITDQKRIEAELAHSYKKLQKLARVDDLSGLYNRRYFYEQLEKFASIYSNRNDGTTFSLICIDVDDMNQINETHGAQNGDTVLRTLSSVLLNNTRKADTCFRIGGDEFAIVLPDTDKLGAIGIANKIVNNVYNTPIRFEGSTGKFTISGGVVEFDVDIDLSEMLSLAERKVARSKRNGKNQMSM